MGVVDCVSVDIMCFVARVWGQKEEVKGFVEGEEIWDVVMAMLRVDLAPANFFFRSDCSCLDHVLHIILDTKEHEAVFFG